MWGEPTGVRGFSSQRASSRDSVFMSLRHHFFRSVPLKHVLRSQPRHKGGVNMPNKIAAILQTTFSNRFSCMKSTVFWFGFHWILFSRIEFIIWARTGSDNGLMPRKWQAIINDGLVYLRIYAWLGFVELLKNNIFESRETVKNTVYWSLKRYN